MSNTIIMFHIIKNIYKSKTDNLTKRYICNKIKIYMIIQYINIILNQIYGIQNNKYKKIYKLIMFLYFEQEG